MSKNWKRGLALLMAAMMLAPSSNLTAWQTALGTAALVAEASTPTTTTIEAARTAITETAADGTISINGVSYTKDHTGTGWKTTTLGTELDTIKGYFESAAIGDTVKDASDSNKTYTYAAEREAAAEVPAGFYNSSIAFSLSNLAAGDKYTLDGETIITVIADEGEAEDNQETLTNAKTALGSNTSASAKIIDTSDSNKEYTYSAAVPAVTHRDAGFYAEGSDNPFTADNLSIGDKVTIAAKADGAEQTVTANTLSLTEADMLALVIPGATVGSDIVSAEATQTVVMTVPESDEFTAAIELANSEQVTAGLSIVDNKDNTFDVPKGQPLDLTITYADGLVERAIKTVKIGNTVLSSIATEGGESCRFAIPASLTSGSGTVSVEMATVLDKTVSIADASTTGAEVIFETTGSITKKDGTALASGTKAVGTSDLGDDETKDAFFSEKDDVVIKFKVAAKTGYKLVANDAVSFALDTTTYFTDPSTGAQHIAECFSYDATSKVYTLRIPKDVAKENDNVEISVDTVAYSDANKAVLTLQYDHATVEVLDLGTDSVDEKSTGSKTYDVHISQNPVIKVTVDEGYQLKAAETDLNTAVTLTSVGGAGESTDLAITASGTSDTFNCAEYSIDKAKFGTTSTTVKIETEKITYQAPSVASNTAIGSVSKDSTAPTSWIAAETVDFPATSAPANLTVAPKYGEDYTFYAYSVVANADGDEASKSGSVNVTATVGGVPVPMTKSGNMYTIPGSYFTGVKDTALAITATAVSTTDKATEATAVVYETIDGEDVEYTSIVRAQKTDTATYNIKWSSATLDVPDSKVSDSLKDIVVTGDRAVVAGSTYNSLKVVRNAVGKATVKLLYNGKVVNTINVEVNTGIGSSFTVTPIMTSDVDTKLKYTTDANYEDGDFFIYSVIENLGKSDDWSQEMFKQRVVSTGVTVSDISELETIDLTRTGLAKGQGGDSSWKVTSYLVKANSQGAAAALVTADKLADSIENGLVKVATTDVKTIAPTYETKLTLTKKQTTVVSGFDYDTILDVPATIAKIAYTNKTAFKYVTVGVASKKYATIASDDMAKNDYAKPAAADWDAIINWGEDGDYKALTIDKLVTVSGKPIWPGTYDITVTAADPSGRVSNKATAKVTITVTPALDFETPYNMPVIVRPDGTNKAVSVTPYIVSYNKGAVKSIEYKFTDKSVVDATGSQVTDLKKAGISIAKNGKVTLAKTLKSLDGYRFAVEAKLTLKDGTVLTTKECSSALQGGEVTISKASQTELDDLVLVKTSDIGAITAEKIVDPTKGISIDDVRAGLYSVVAVDTTTVGETTTYVAHPAGTFNIASSSTKVAGVYSTGLNANKIWAEAAGTFTFTATPKDASVQRKTLKVKIDKAVNNPVAWIGDDWTTPTWSNGSMAAGPALEVTNKSDMLTPFEVIVGSVSADNQWKYIETTVTVKGGKVIYKYEKSNFEKDYTILPTAEKTIITVTNKLDTDKATKTKTYTVTNEKWSSVKGLTLSAAKINGNAPATVKQELKIKVTGNADTLAQAAAVKLSADSLYNACYGKTGAAKDKADLAYNRGWDVLARLKLNNASSDTFKIVSEKDSKGKVSYYILVDATSDGNDLVGGTYSLDASIIGFAADGKSVGTTEICKKSSVKFTVSTTKPSYSVKGGVTINDIQGEQVKINQTVKNGKIVFGENYSAGNNKAMNIKNTRTGKSNAFAEYFFIDENGILTVLKPGAKGDNLKGVVQYTVYDTNDNKIATKTVNITVKTKAAANAEALLIAGLNRAVSQAAFDMDPTATNINQAAVQQMLSDELAARGYVEITVAGLTGVAAVAPNYQYTPVSFASAGVVKDIITVEYYAQKLETDAEAADYNKKNGTSLVKGNGIPGTETSVDIVVNATYGKRADYGVATYESEIRTIITNTVTAIDTNKFAGTKASDSAAILAALQTAVGSEYTVAYKGDVTYTAPTISAAGSIGATVTVTNKKDATKTFEASVSKTIAKIMTLLEAKTAVNTALNNVAYDNNITVEKLIAKANAQIGQTGRFRVANGTGEEAIVIKKSTYAETGSVIGLLTVVRTDGVEDTSNVDNNKKSKMITKPIAKIDATTANAKTLVAEAFASSTYKLNVNQTNTALARAIKSTAVSAISETTNAGNFSVTVSKVSPSFDTNGKVTKVDAIVTIEDTTKYQSAVTYNYSYTVKTK